MKVYGVTGLPGSGKSIISRIAKKQGIHTISMGDVIRKEAEQKKCSTAAAAVNLRKNYGNNIIADRCVKHIQNHSRKTRKHRKTQIKKIHNKNRKPVKYKKIKQDIYIIEGIRSPYEVNYFRKFFKNFKVIAIYSTPESRFNRLKKRNRSDDSTDFKKFQERDRRELNFGIGNVIALSDYMLINEGPIQNFKTDIRALIKNEIKPRPKQHKSKNKNKTKQNRKFKKGRKQYKKYTSRKQTNNPKR